MINRTAMMELQEIGGMEQMAEHNIKAERKGKMRAFFYDSRVLPYFFYPKEAIKVAISIIMI